MISNLPDWITAGTAVTAVFGGLFGVYTTTQSRLDVTDERLANAIIILEKLSEREYSVEEDLKIVEEKMTRNEVSAEYLRKGQDRLHDSMNLLAGEVRQLNQTVLTNHAR